VQWPAWFRKKDRTYKIPVKERYQDIDIYHPRFFNFPILFKSLDARLMRRCVAPVFNKIVREFQPNVVDAHWGYPDGVEEGMLERANGIPYFVTLRGDDVTVFLRTSARKSQMLNTLNMASAVIGVSRALIDAAVEAGVRRQRCVVIPNSVDIKIFYPEDRMVARNDLGLDAHRPVILSVGHICELKGFHLLVEALTHLSSSPGRSALLVIVGGSGRDRDYVAKLRRTVNRLGLRERVLMPGAASPDRLRTWYSAADLFCLASAREGSPNVVREALACGCPVVATRVGGIPEILSNQRIGMMVERDAVELADTIDAALSRSWDRHSLMVSARARSWSDTARSCLRVFEKFA
jgi:glycosyltransferase involved in cell wall biosynthesis